MKLLINASILTEKPTGVGIYNIELLKRLLPKLDQQGIEYTVYCYDPSLIKCFIKKNNVKKISLGFWGDKIFLNFLSLHRILWNTFLLDKVALDYGLIYALSTYGSIKNKKQIVTVHDLIALQFPKQHKLQYLYFRFIVPGILHHCKMVIAVSDFTAKEIVHFYPAVSSNKIQVVKSGIDHVVDYSNFKSDQYVDKITCNQPFCLVVGASYYHKNMETLLKVAEVLKPENVRFVIAGRASSYYRQLIKQAKHQQLTNIFFMSYVDGPTLASLYKKATLHVYISLYEGFGFPPAEAAFYGTRSVISKQQALLEIYGSYFPSADPLDVNTIANSIKQNLLKTTKDNTVFSALKTVYNWEATASAIYKLLTSEI